ncbi:MAG: phage major tail protein, TP901-1 family [Maricaulaceae bacterium]
MTAQRGRDMLVKIQNIAGDYITVAGLRTKTLTFNASTVDVTDHESVNQWRELLPGSGVKTADISGAGVFKDAESDALIRTAFFDQSQLSCRFVLPDFGQVDGVFLINRLSFAGTFGGEPCRRL